MPRRSFQPKDIRRLEDEIEAILAHLSKDVEVEVHRDIPVNRGRLFITPALSEEAKRILPAGARKRPVLSILRAIHALDPGAGVEDLSARIRFAIDPEASKHKVQVGVAPAVPPEYGATHGRGPRLRSGLGERRVQRMPRPVPLPVEAQFMGRSLAHQAADPTFRSPTREIGSVRLLMSEILDDLRRYEVGPVAPEVEYASDAAALRSLLANNRARARNLAGIEKSIKEMGRLFSYMAMPTLGRAGTLEVPARMKQMLARVPEAFGPIGARLGHIERILPEGATARALTKKGLARIGRAAGRVAARDQREWDDRDLPDQGEVAPVTPKTLGKDYERWYEKMLGKGMAKSPEVEEWLKRMKKMKGPAALAGVLALAVAGAMMALSSGVGEPRDAA